MSKIALGAASLFATLLRVAGYILGIPMLLFTALAVVDVANGLSVSILLFLLAFDLACALLVYGGMRIKRRVLRFKRYVWLISQEGITSIPKLAVETHQTALYVKNDLYSMIRSRYFVNARIDETSARIIIEHPLDELDVTGLDTETVVCTGCGASVTKRRNTAASCEYCGSAVA